MANPKYIDIPTPAEDGAAEDTKKVTKKPYSFRCDERLLDDMSKYAELEGVSMPQLLSDMMADFLKDKTLTNTYLPEYESQYINIPSNVNDDKYEYELRTVVNNLDIWTNEYGYVSKHHEAERKMYDGLLHEGIDFVVIPETVHLSKIPDYERMGRRAYHINMDYTTSCLYCMYITVNNCHHVEYEVISWIDAMNKLKSVGRHDLISYGNKIKKSLADLHQIYITEEGMHDDCIFYDEMYNRLLSIADAYNTGAILPASKSIDNIEYAAIVKHLPDSYDLISKLMKENKELKGIAAEFQAMKDKIREIDEREYSREEIWEYIKQQHNSNEEDLPESDDD